MSKVIIDGVEYVPKVEEIEAKKWPQVGDIAYLLWHDGRINETYFDGTRGMEEGVRLRNIFPTEQKAEYERLRRECMATRWVPEGCSEFFIASVDQFGKVKFLTVRDGKFLCGNSIILGLAASTHEGMCARWNEYGEAWLDALTPKK